MYALLQLPAPPGYPSSTLTSIGSSTAGSGNGLAHVTEFGADLEFAPEDEILDPEEAWMRLCGAGEEGR